MYEEGVRVVNGNFKLQTSNFKLFDRSLSGRTVVEYITGA
jgi:hypothetical protein